MTNYTLAVMKADKNDIKGSFAKAKAGSFCIFHRQQSISPTRFRVRLYVLLILFCMISYKSVFLRTGALQSMPPLKLFIHRGRRV